MQEYGQVRDTKLYHEVLATGSYKCILFEFGLRIR